jgi:hypothetical protein
MQPIQGCDQPIVAAVDLKSGRFIVEHVFEASGEPRHCL